MSNSSDPMPTPPDHSDPKAGPKPDAAPPGSAERQHTGGSSFDFQLPKDGSFSDLPPVGQPEEIGTSTPHVSLPPRPAAAKPMSDSFDFIELPDIPLPPVPDSNIHSEAPAPLPGSDIHSEASASPAPAGDADLPFAIETAGDSGITFVPSGPSSGSSSSILTDSDVLPTAELLSEPSSPSTPDISTLLPPPAVPTAAPGAFTGDRAIAELELPLADPDSGVTGGTLPPAAPSTPELDSILGELEPIDPASGWLDKPVVGPVAGEGRASFDFALPEGVKSFGDLPPVTQPVPNDPAAALPPRPIATHPAAEATSFDFIELAGDGAAPPAHDPAAVAGAPEPVDPVAPASGWLDSVVRSGPVAPAEPVPAAEAVPFDLGPSDILDSSDILSGARVETAQPAEQSDVITAGPPAEPSGGDTDSDGFADLVLADEATDSGTLLMSTPASSDSIHEMPALPSVDPLFDSTRIGGELPDVSPAELLDDATDYGAAPALSSDASSILSDLNGPADGTGQDSSSVRVEEPGVDRTLTAGAIEGAFDLTVADEPVPADLFGPSADSSATDATDWQSQSGSDLFSDARTAAEIDLGSDPAEAVDLGEIDLGTDPASLTSAPSSIFSDRPAGPGAASGGSANVRIGTPESASDIVAPGPSATDLTDSDIADIEAAEFTDHPTQNTPAEREKGRRASSGDIELPPAPAAHDGAIDWDAAGLADDENATRGITKDASLAALMSALEDDSSELPTRTSRPVARIGEDDDVEGPVVTVDWLASSGEGSAVTDAQVAEAKAAPTAPKPTERKEKQKPDGRAKKTRGEPAHAADTGSGTADILKGKPSKASDSGEPSKRKSGKKAGGLVIGGLVGALVAGGALAGVYLGGLVPNSERVALGPPPPIPPRPGQSRPNQPGANGGLHVPPATQVAPADPLAEFHAGDTAKALDLLKSSGPNSTEGKATAGYVRLFAKVQEAAKANAATVAADDDLKQARADLADVIADTKAQETAEGEKRAVQAAVRLGVSYEVTGDFAMARKVFTDAMEKFKKHADVFEALIDRLDAAEKAGAGTSFRAPRELAPEDALRVLFAVSVLLADEPKAGDDPEPGLFYWKAVNQAAAGKFPEAIDLIGKAKSAHVKRAKALAGRGLNPLTDPLEQMFARSCDELTAYWKLRGELYGNPAVAAAIKKDGVAKALDALAKTESDLATAKADAVKRDKELKAVQDAADERTKLHQAAELAANKKITEISEERDKLDAVIRKQKEQITALGEFEKEVTDALKPAVKLPEKYGPADVVAGVKATAARATGPDLKTLVPSTMTAIGGGGLSTGQLLDIAERLTKAEDTAKVANDKLATETKKFTEKYDADTTKLKAGHITELKKLSADHVAAVAALKEQGAADLKALTEKYTADAKKLTDTYAADLKKLKDTSEEALKAEQARTAAEKKAAADKEISFQKQLANAVTPAQAMDLWLPALTDLRRPADADPALAAAVRARESAAPDSEDAAKAHTVTGMALLLKGNLAAAKEEFQAARRGPAYAAAKGKAWARAADAGLEAVDDPLAPYRLPVVVPPVDVKVAAKALDAGIAAYKAARYDEAVAALADAAKNDPADPVAWYYLGSARWARGNTKQAEKDFGQGAEREKASPVPARTVSAALAPIQGAVRDALDRARP